jgi:hypothetical protein
LKSCTFDITLLLLFAYACFSYHGTATSAGLKLNEKALLSKAFFELLKKKFKLAIVTGRPRKVRIHVLLRGFFDPHTLEGLHGVLSSAFVDDTF